MLNVKEGTVGFFAAGLAWIISLSLFLVELMDSTNLQEEVVVVETEKIIYFSSCTQEKMVRRVDQWITDHPRMEVVDVCHNASKGYVTLVVTSAD